MKVDDLIADLRAEIAHLCVENRLLRDKVCALLRHADRAERSITEEELLQGYVRKEKRDEAHQGKKRRRRQVVAQVPTRSRAG